MAQKNRELHDDDQPEIAAEHYYDYEARFVKQKREQERINILPRVIKPAMFAQGEFALGDMRVFSRYTVAPLSMLTGGFLELRSGAQTQPRRMIPSLIAYIIDGSGESFQDSVKFQFSAGDVVLIPPYTTYQFLADPKAGFRAWLPQLRLWHGQGLLWRDPMSEGSENESAPISDRKVKAVFQSRRQIHTSAPGKTRYDWFLSRLADENRVERENPGVIRAAERAWESTRQGRLKFYISRWTEVAASGLDVMAQEIAPGERSGAHRHIFEELLLVVKGHGYDLHDGTKHPWKEGDLICVPPMIVHQHINAGNDAARLVSVWPRQPGHELLGGIEQISDASDWKR
jgi:quercetin dioxygenase-like cupin family protein